MACRLQYRKRMLKFNKGDCPTSAVSKISRKFIYCKIFRHCLGLAISVFNGAVWS